MLQTPNQLVCCQTFYCSRLQLFRFPESPLCLLKFILFLCLKQLYGDKINFCLSPSRLLGSRPSRWSFTAWPIHPIQKSVCTFWINYVIIKSSRISNAARKMSYSLFYVLLCLLLLLGCAAALRKSLTYQLVNDNSVCRAALTKTVGLEKKNSQKKMSFRHISYPDTSNPPNPEFSCNFSINAMVLSRRVGVAL